MKSRAEHGQLSITSFFQPPAKRREEGGIPPETVHESPLQAECTKEATLATSSEVCESDSSSPTLPTATFTAPSMVEREKVTAIQGYLRPDKAYSFPAQV